MIVYEYEADESATEYFIVSSNKHNFGYLYRDSSDSLGSFSLIRIEDIPDDAYDKKSTEIPLNIYKNLFRIIFKYNIKSIGFETVMGII